MGCDGGKSLVRSTLGIEYFGRGAMRPNVSFFFRSSEFIESHSLGRGTLYFLFNPNSFGVFTAINGHTERATINVDSDPLYGPFVRQVARTLDDGFRGMPTLGELEDGMRIIWRAYDADREGLHHG